MPKPSPRRRPARRLALSLGLVLATTVATPAAALILPRGPCRDIIDCRSGTCVPYVCSGRSISRIGVLDVVVQWISGKRFAW